MLSLFQTKTQFMSSPPSPIPKKIWQTWKSKNVPRKMARNIAKMREMNPDYDYNLADDVDCVKLLMDNFGPNYVNAFWAPRFGMFRADLYRYAVLWLYGGVYLDADAVMLKPFDTVVRYPFTLVIPKDREKSGLYQAFIACTPNHPAIWHMLQLAFYNIASRRPIINDLALSGPLVSQVAVNLYLNKSYTTKQSCPGIYDDGKMLIIEHQGHVSFDRSYVVDDSGERFFLTKYPGYRNPFTLHSLRKQLHLESYYVDGKDEATRHLFMKIYLQRATIFALLILVLGLCIAILWKT